MDGQMSIFDFPEYLPEGKDKRKAEIKKQNEGDPVSPAQQYYIETGRTDYWQNGRDMCKYSGHSCNKRELWNIADSFDEIVCPHVCCRRCSAELCGARCNGAPEPCKPIFDTVECPHDSRYLCDRWRDQEEVDRGKSELIKGFACTGCCWYCSQAPVHGGKCRFDCRRTK